jgi:hypothetical protein
MRICTTSIGALVAVASMILSPAVVRAGDTAVDEIVAVLREKNLIDDAESTKILAKNLASQTKPSAAGPLAGIELFGDLRARYESLYFDTDSLGNEADDRPRLRYRLRFGAQKKLSDRFTVGLRIASDLNDPRSTNSTLGDMPDFGPDPVTIDRAFLEYRLPTEPIEGLDARLSFGKTENPFRWSQGGDFLIWDSDISLEGVSLSAKLPLSERAWTFANLGSYVIQELSMNADPKVTGLQLGGGLRPSETLEVGLRASGYEYRSLDPTFIARAKTSALSGGNTDGAFDSRARIAELAGYLRWSGSESWPVLAFFNAAKNLNADTTTFQSMGSSVRVGKEDNAIVLGFEVGDAKKLVRVGAAFFEVEPNAIVALFTDSDILDGRSNGRGYVFFASRFLFPGIELRVTLSDTDSLRNRARGTGPFVGALSNRDRKRLQTDLLVSF